MRDAIVKSKKLKVKVSGVLFPKEEDDRKKRDAGERCLFYVLDCASDVGAIKAKGELPARPAKGEIYELTGDYVEWNGERQFRFAAARPYLPVDERSMLAYACELTKGIGPAMEQKIWEACGEKWREVGEGVIKGLTAEKVAMLRRTVEELSSRREQAEAISWMMQHGLSVHLAQVAWDAWRDRTVATVRGNCYALCDLPNYGFSHIDGDIRRSFGIADDDPRRLTAAVRHCLDGLTSRGSTVVPWYMLRSELLALVPDAGDAIQRTVGDMVARGSVVFFYSSQLLADQLDYLAESAIWEFAKEEQHGA